MESSERNCPYCHSTNVLPYEQESDYKKNYSLSIIVLAALVLIAGYFIFLFSAYLYFPLVVFIAIIFTTKFLDKKKEDREKDIQFNSGKQFICLNCNNSFTD